MILGQRMIRLEDGQRGIVCQNGPELRVMYIDRGEERLAAKSERWIADDVKPGPLRAEERYLIALHADRALRAYECNEPLKWWEQLAITDVPYDSAFTRAIESLLTERETRGVVL